MDVTPRIGCRLAGYPIPRRTATTVHDPLHARVLVLEANDRRVAIVSLDAMAIEIGWVGDVRRQAQELGIAPANLLVAATHSHSTPGHLFAFDGPVGPALQAVLGESVGPVDHGLRDDLARLTLEGIAGAIAAMRPATVRSGAGQLVGVAANRIDPALPVDLRCRVVAIDDRDGAAIATVLHHACHPTVLAAEDRGLSADVPGAATRRLEETVGGVALFLNGALGDVSTRFTRRGRGPGEVDRLGRLLADAALRIRAGARPIPAEPLASSATVRLTPKGPPAALPAAREPLNRPASSALDDGERRRLEVAREGIEIAARLRPHLPALSGIDVEIQVLELGSRLALVAVPLEVFSALGTAIGELDRTRDIALVGPANGYLGYLPTAAAWDVGGYEVDSSLLGPGAGDELLAAVRSHLEHAMVRRSEERW